MPGLMWVARIALMLPLPPLWYKERDSLGNFIYTHKYHRIATSAHPSSEVVNKIVQRARYNHDKQ